MRYLTTFLVVMVTLVQGVAIADSKAGYLDENGLISALRSGGYNLYFRHEATDWSQNDKVNRVDDWLSCDGNKIRQLSDKGRKSAMTTGRSIKALGIPIGKVIASPYCRTVETAKLMDLGPVEPSNNVINLRIASFFGGRDAIIKTAQTLLATKPAEATNHLIVAHGNVAREATPIYPGEGEGVVFRPDGYGGFEPIGRLTAEDWVRLATSMSD